MYSLKMLMFNHQEFRSFDLLYTLLFGNQKQYNRKISRQRYANVNHDGRHWDNSLVSFYIINMVICMSENKDYVLNDRTNVWLMAIKYSRSFVTCSHVEPDIMIWVEKWIVERSSKILRENSLIFYDLSITLISHDALWVNFWAHALELKIYWFDYRSDNKYHHWLPALFLML